MKDINKFRNFSKYIKVEDVIGNKPLTDETIRENSYTVQQILANHKPIGGSYVCKICQRKVLSRLSFIAHLRLHTGEFVAHCHRCGKGVTRVWHLKDHEKHCPALKKPKEDNAPPAKKMKMNENQIQYLQEHTARIIQELNEFDPNDIGDIPLSEKIIRENKYTVRQVYRSHTYNGGKFTCKVCGKCVSTKDSFIAHLRMHTGEFVAHCRYCGRGVVRKQHLINHEKLCAVGKGRVSRRSRVSPF